jgi:lysophospholipase L1-like esterase
MRQRHLTLAAIAAAAAVCASACAAPAPRGPALPNSMASTGDSITRAYDIDWLHVLSDTPQASWSTGYSGVSSQYQRLLALNPAIAGRDYNDAKTGAKMADLDGQVMAAKTQGVQYLTVLMGANDLCSKTGMTPTATFQAQFDRALADFTANNPNAKVFVSSIPNIYQLWSVQRSNPAAQNTWKFFGICQSMLSSTNTEAQRQLVVAQESADNAILQADCAAQPACRFDNFATYNFSFPASDVSPVDYFHPNLAGQNDLARVSWGASYWGGP